MVYVVVLEKGKHNYSAYVSNLSGCIAVGDSLEDVKKSMAEAIDFHLEGMQRMGMEVPSCWSLRFVFEMDSNID